VSVSEQTVSGSLRPNAVLEQLTSLKGSLPVPVLLYLIAIFMPIAFSLGPVHMTLVRLLLILMIVPLSINLLMGRYGRVLITDVLFFLHVMWIIVALAVNNPNQAIANAGSTGIEFIGGYVLGRAYIQSKGDFIALIRALVLISLCCFPFVVFEALTGTALVLNILQKIPGISSEPDLSLDIRMGMQRVQMVFVHPIHWGLYCSLVLSLCFIGFKGIYTNTWRFFVALIVGFSGLLALSSGALLAIIMQLMLFAWAWSFRKTDKRWIILLAVIAVFYVVIDLFSDRTPIMVFLSYATFSAHTAYWRTIIFDWGMINIWANPIFGLGLNDWVRPVWMYSGSMDNFWLVMGVRYGIPGFVFIALGYVVALWKISRRKFDGDEILWNLRRAWMFSFIGLTFTITTVHIWHTVYSFVFFMFGSGMWLLTTKPNTTEISPDTGAEPATGHGPAYSRTREQNQMVKQDQMPTAATGVSYTRFPKKPR
jgi:O-antigen ligase